MRLLIDVGNTRIKAAVQSGTGLQLLPAQAYVDQGLDQALNAWSMPDQVEDCWVASVGHQDLHPVIDDWAREQGTQGVHFVVSEAGACGVSNAYEQPGNLGVDRWLSIIAAHHRAAGPAVVVSAGTAATIDAVDAAGRHLGGLITPGLATQRRAMLDHTQVRANALNEAPALLGNSTDACVSFGTLHALAGYIDRVSGRLAADGQPWRRLMTGGDAEVIAPLLQGEWEIAPNLVLEGLGILAQSAAD